MQPAVSLADLLADETREVGDFIQLLREEQALLASSGNADALLPVVGRKAEAAGRLRAISDRREQYLAARRYPAGRQGMEACLAAAPDGKALQGEWRKLLALAKEARALNETNGKLIVVHYQHNQKALAALMAAADSAMVYGPDGQQTGSGGGRRFLSSA
ncbi:MAG: flagella synthesis protein FlgN [Ignavibacteria bacterium]